MLLLASVCLAACDAKPVPADKAEYAGTWEGGGMHLSVTAEGRATFSKDNGAVKFSGPITQWFEEDFVVGVMVMRRKIDVTAPPHQVDGRWRMSVEGIELTRR